MGIARSVYHLAAHVLDVRRAGHDRPQDRKTQAKHKVAVKEHLDMLLSLQREMAEQIRKVQGRMKGTYDLSHREQNNEMKAGSWCWWKPRTSACRPRR